MYPVTYHVLDLQNNSQNQFDISDDKEIELFNSKMKKFVFNAIEGGLSPKTLSPEISIKPLELYNEDNELDVDVELAAQIDAYISEKIINNQTDPFIDTDLKIFSDDAHIKTVKGIKESEYRQVCALYEKIASNMSCFMPSDEIREQFLAAIKKLLTRKIGRELIYSFINHNQPIKITFGDKPAAYGTHVCMGRQPTWIIEQRPNGQMRIRELPFFLTLAHELTHVLHRLNGQEAGSGKPTLHRDYHDLGEQFTITGWKSCTIYFPINEQTITGAFVSKESCWYPRFGHEGFEGFLKGIKAIRFLVEQKLIVDLKEKIDLDELSKLLKEPEGKNIFSNAKYNAEAVAYFLEKNLVDGEGSSILKYLEKSCDVGMILEHSENNKISSSHREMISKTLKPAFQTLINECLECCDLQSSDQKITFLNDTLEFHAKWLRELADTHVKFKDVILQELQNYELIIASKVQNLKQSM